MEISVSEQMKKRILEYIDKANIGRNFSESFINDAIKNLEENNIVQKELTNAVLEELYTQSARYRDLRPNAEFQDRMQEVYERFDNIPKIDRKDMYGQSYIEFEEMQPEEMSSSLQACFDMIDLEYDYYLARDMRKFAGNTIESITYIENNGIRVSEESKINMSVVSNELQELLQRETTDVTKIQNLVSEYNKVAVQIWDDFLILVEEPSNGEIRYLVHQGLIEGEFRDKYMSTSLVTDNAMGTYGKAGQGYGVIVKPKSIVSAESKDTMTGNSGKQGEFTSFLGQRFPIKLPQQIEQEMMEETIEKNGEILKYDKRDDIYSEVVVDEFEIVGVYVITDRNGEPNHNYKRAVKYAEEKGLPFKELDIAKMKETKGETKNEEQNQEGHKDKRVDDRVTFLDDIIKEGIDLGVTDEEIIIASSELAVQEREFTNGKEQENQGGRQA